MRKLPRKLNFTKDAINRIELPAGGVFYVYDEKTLGLALCVTAGGTKTFYHYRKQDGRPEREKLGRWPHLNVDQVRRLATARNGEIALGINTAATKKIKKTAPTFQEIYDLFINLPTRTKTKRAKSPVTIKNYKQLFDAYLKDWKDVRISKKSRLDVETLHNKLGLENGNYLANRVLELIRVLYNTAFDQGWRMENPAARLNKFEEIERERFLQADELPRFFAALAEEPDEMIRDCIEVALFTGQRRGNCQRMKWEQIHWERAVWDLPQTKTGKHSVPLVERVMKILKRRHAARDPENPYVFPGRYGREHLVDPMNRWRALLDRAGIDDLRIHDLRRSQGSWQANTGASLSMIGKTLGHSRPETTQIYARLGDMPVRNAMEAAAAAILEAATPRKKRAAK